MLGALFCLYNYGIIHNIEKLICMTINCNNNTTHIVQQQLELLGDFSMCDSYLINSFCSLHLSPTPFASAAVFAFSLFASHTPFLYDVLHFPVCSPVYVCSVSPINFVSLCIMYIYQPHLSPTLCISALHLYHPPSVSAYVPHPTPLRYAHASSILSVLSPLCLPLCIIINLCV